MDETVMTNWSTKLNYIQQLMDYIPSTKFVSLKDENELNPEAVNQVGEHIINMACRKKYRRKLIHINKLKGIQNTWSWKASADGCEIIYHVNYPNTLFRFTLV